MNALFIALIVVMPALQAAAQNPDTVVTRIRWIRNLPQPVKAAWRNCKYADWHIFGIERLATPADTLYMIHVARYQALGPDDADIAEEDLLYFSSTGQLRRIRKL